MATYAFSALPRFAVIGFDPLADVLFFDSLKMTAASLGFQQSGPDLLIHVAGKVLTLRDTDMAKIIAGGSLRFKI